MTTADGWRNKTAESFAVREMLKNSIASTIVSSSRMITTHISVLEDVPLNKITSLTSL